MVDFSLPFSFSMGADIKRCQKCNQDRLVTDFNFRDKARGKRHSHCRFCTLAYCHKWYGDHNEEIRKRASEYWAIRRKVLIGFLWDYLSTHPCIDCGFSDIRALDFDHVRGEKRFDIPYALMKALSVERVKAEIAKCDVRCKNCHAVRTNSANGSWRNRGKV